MPAGDAQRNYNTSITGLDLNEGQLRRILAERLGISEKELPKSLTRGREATSSRGLLSSSMALNNQADINDARTKYDADIQGTANDAIAQIGNQRMTASDLLASGLSQEAIDAALAATTQAAADAQAAATANAIPANTNSSAPPPAPAPPALGLAPTGISHIPGQIGIPGQYHPDQSAVPVADPGPAGATAEDPYGWKAIAAAQAAANPPKPYIAPPAPKPKPPTLPKPKPPVVPRPGNTAPR